MTRLYAPYVKPCLPVVITAFRALAGFSQRLSKGVSHAAPTLTASQPQRPDGAGLLTQCVILEAAAKDARRQRDLPKEALILGELRALKLSILKDGPNATH